MVGADTAWIIVATALVLLMTLPGLALFYGGLVRARNVLSVFTQCYSIACLMSILWLVVGYSIAFGGGDSSFFGGFGRVFLSGVDANTLSGTIPEVLFFAFQMTFAVITPALILGAYVERINFAFVLIFSGAWMLLCYAPIANWIWGGGMLAAGGIYGPDIGTFDFAGGIVVHESAGIAALVIAFFLGPRSDKSKPPHAPGLVMMGAALLWVGWFGFNGGSQLAADGGAAMAITVTHISAAAASLTWILMEKIRFGKCSLVGLVTGTIAGLASITPASGFVGPVEALIIGSVAGVLCQFGVDFVKQMIKIDDTLDVFAVHGIGGIFGTIMIAVFNADASWVAQIGSVVIVGVFTVIMTTIIVKVVGLIVPIRVANEDEISGLDMAAHGERGYEFSS